MAKPASRQELIDYALRQLGAPVLEINVSEEQIDDRLDDALQYFNERHFDGVEKMFLKYKITQDDIDTGRGRNVTTQKTDTNAGATPASRTLDFDEGRGYLTVPDHIIGVQGVLPISNTYVGNMFGFRYQFFLNDFYNFNSYDILSLEMTMQHIQTLEFLLEGQKPIRYNKVQNRLYVDIDWNRIHVNEYIVIDCYRALDPVTFTKLYNERFVKEYLTSLIKKQWGQNLIKFSGIKMPGGVEFNGRQIYDDAVAELDKLEQKMSTTYELPPLDFVG